MSDIALGAPGGAGARYATAGLLGVSTVLTAVGIVGVGAIIYWPILQKVS